MNINANITQTANPTNFLDELLESVQLTKDLRDMPEGKYNIIFSEMKVNQNPSSGYIFIEFYGALDGDRVRVSTILNEMTGVTCAGLLKASGCKNLKQLQQKFTAGETVAYTVTQTASADGRYMNWR